ncbi:MAG: TIGR01777 family oxidoreductase [Desulfobulbaceae bacterium]|nr:TIGR01777 family oxidoreductase [Desulfobulbaceae bacterium]
MNVFITGGTGFVGRNLTAGLIERGHAVTILTRHGKKRRLHPAVSFVAGDPNHKGAWQERLQGHDAVINLAGASIFCRWNKKNKKILMESRLRTTENIVDGIASLHNRPAILLNASGIGYYGRNCEEETTETAVAGDDFLARLASAWEESAQKAEKLGVRVVLCRFGAVLGKDGGAMQRMLTTFRLGLGSPLGTGSQWFPWIHIKDLVNGMLFLLEHQKTADPVNFTAPQTITNREMSQALGKALKKPVFLPPVPGFVLKLLLGPVSQIVLYGQKAIPKKLLDNGYTFSFPTIDEAFADLVEE